MKRISWALRIWTESRANHLQPHILCVLSQDIDRLCEVNEKLTADSFPSVYNIDRCSNYEMNLTNTKPLTDWVHHLIRGMAHYLVLKTVNPLLHARYSSYFGKHVDEPGTILREERPLVYVKEMQVISGPVISVWERRWRQMETRYRIESARSLLSCITGIKKTRDSLSFAIFPTLVMA